MANTNSWPYRPAWLDRLHGAILLTGGVLLLLQPYPTLGWGFRLLPWALLVLAGYLLCRYRAVPQGRRHSLLLLPVLPLAGTAAFLWFRPDWSDRILWYGVAFYWLYTALLLLNRTFFRQPFSRWTWGAAGTLTLLLALGMLWYPASGFSTALQLSGWFGAALGMVLIFTARRKQP